MFFAASKIMIWLIYPLSLGILLLILAYAAALLRKRAPFHILFWLGFVILYLFSIAPVRNFLLNPLERKYPSLQRSELKADAIVVLSGDVRKRVVPEDDIEVGGNRVLKAVRLYQRGAAPIIIMTGGSGDFFDPSFKEAVLMKDLAIEFGVPKDKIIIETESRNTRENVVYTKRLLDKVNAKKIILVTAAFHVPRSYALLRKVGIDVIPAATDYRVTDEKYDPFSFIPNSGNLSLSSIAIKEYVGLFVYRLMGWI